MTIKDLATSEEIKEVNVTLQGVVKIKPTFVQFGTQFYRVIAPLNHPHINSDMSMEGLKDWHIVK